MANKMKEAAPVEITLGNILKVFLDNEKMAATSMVNDKVLVGEDICNILYERIKDGSSSITKIRNCVNATQTETYSQAYNHYSKIFKKYFKNNVEVTNDSENQKNIAFELRAFILEVWKKKLQIPISDYEGKIVKFLTDNTLRNSSADSVKEIRKFIMEYQYASSVDDQAELFTVLTLLSITRCHWAELPISLILPEKYKTKEQLIDKSDIEIAYKEGKQAFEDGNYEEALEKLENLEQYRIGILHSQDEINKFYSKVFVLRSKVCRKILEGIKDETERENSKKDICGNLNRAIKWHNTEAMIIVAREYFAEQPDAVFCPDKSECVKLCEKIVRDYPEAMSECGEAFWMLYSMEENDTKKEEYLKKSADYSYHKAVKRYKEKNAVSLIATLEKSMDNSFGVYAVNENNRYFDIIRETAPKSWKKIDYPIQNTSSRCDYKELETYIIENKGKQRFFLVSNDFEKNLKELLYFLQAIKSSSQEEVDSYFEFFIRGEEEKISPFIDTALARIENRIIPVHILDDNKQAARVLAQHPLFYPIRRQKQKEPVTLKFVVIGNTKVCNWLIREASWLLTFRDEMILTEMIIIAPDARKVSDKVKYQCSEMNFEKLKVIPKNLNYESADFLEEIENILSGGYTYFALDIGSEIENMSLAIKIRECCIREKLKKQEEEFNTDMPVIAFYCQDSDIANLSYRTVVINENHGNHWFNNYALIPFGRIDRQYHWDSLTNHILEKLSLNIHLQYYLDDENNIELYEKKYYNGLKDYYGRTYNRDSSMAVAMSLPYRLYQGIVDGKRILPVEPLNILDEDTFYSEEMRGKYVKWVRKIKWETSDYERTFTQIRQSGAKVQNEIDTELIEESEVYQMAEWEQKRWNRFMISRGWISAEIKQMKLYYEKGNHSQQLYIGKMHPCIKEYKRLEIVQNKWKELSQKDKNFQKSNITSIQRTEKILTLYWLEKSKDLLKDSTDL